MIKKIYAGAAITLAVFVLSMPKTADAIPAFARKFQVGCENCHRAFPLLNPTGEKFKEEGFQNRSGGSFDGGDKEKSQIDKKLVLEKMIFPLSIRVIGDIKTKQESGATPDTKSRASIELPHEVELMAAGTLFKNVGYFAEAVWEAGSTDVEQAYISFNNLTGDNTLNVRAGLLEVNEWGLPGAAPLLQKKLRTTDFTIAADSWKMRNGEQAIEIYGRPADGILFYNVGVSNGIKGFNAEDNNSAKNIFERIGFNIGEQEFGILGYHGKNSRSTSTTTAYPEENRFIRYGFDYNLRIGDLNIYGQHIMGHDKNPTFAANPAKVDSKACSVNLNYQVSPILIAVLQYDYSKKKHDDSSRHTFLTPGVGYYPLQNLRTVVEYQFDLVKRDSRHTRKEDRFNIRLDFAI